MAIDIKSLKEEISKSGTNRGKFLFLREGGKARVRFLTEFSDGVTVPFHDNYKLSVNVPCQELFGRQCPHCDDEDLRTRNQYAWAVFDYESNEVKILMHAINNCTPVGALAAFFEAYGTITDRDYELKKIGSGTNTTYSVVPLNPTKFRNKNAKPMSEQAILKAIDKAYPCEGVEDDEDEEEEKPRKTNKQKKAGKKNQVMPEPEETEEEWPDEEQPDYSSMKARELYDLCIERGIDCETRMSKQYYIDLLEDADQEETEEEWPDE